MKGFTKEWALTMAFSLFCLLALGLGLTWVNIERVDLAYELKRMQTEIEAQESLIAKLEVERNTLLTPERLRVLAREYGLTQARPGQIRRLTEIGDELPSPVIKAAAPNPEKPQKKAEPVKTVKAPKSGSKENRSSGKAGRTLADQTLAKKKNL